MQIIYQGDLGFLKIPNESQIPDGFVPLPKSGNVFILAKGVVSTHTHAIKSNDIVEVYYDPNSAQSENGYDEMYIWVSTSALVEHEEHTSIKLTAGLWKKYQQKEYSFEDEYRVIAD